MADHDWLYSGVHDLTTKTAIADSSIFIRKMQKNEVRSLNPKS